jgi:error-prone DNA polymerase
MIDAAGAAYAELHCHSYFSLLDAASSPEELAATAKELGLAALALTDHDNLSGAVRFSVAARRAGLHAVFGAEVTLANGAHLTLVAETQVGYANLCRLITAARRNARSGGENPAVVADDLPPDLVAWEGKVAPVLAWETLATHTQGLIALSGCRRGEVAAALLRGEEGAAQAALRRLYDLFGAQHLFVELQHHDLPGDDRLARKLIGLAHRLRLPLVATHNVHYATSDYSMLCDALIAVRNHATLAEAQRAGQLPFNSSYALASPAEMARRFAQRPEALANSLAIAERCQVSLDFSAQRLPVFAAPGGMPVFQYLYQLCHERLPHCYPDLNPQVLKQLTHELDVIEAAGLATYFLVVWDIVRYAREQRIRCQGRGSAANSIVAYLLGITSIDPLAHHLLFERFLSSDKFTMPDIDIDFAADRREEVIQYVYRTYGHDYTAMVCNTVTYRARSAIRDLCKVLELPEKSAEQLAGRLDTHSPLEAAKQLEGMAPPHLISLLRRIDGCPRHLSIHSGGMLISGGQLDAIVPIEPATMPGRFVAQWDKDSVEDAGLIKIDLLALRTLGVVSEALEHINQSGEPAPDLDRLPLDDPAVYGLLQEGDTIGAFQVESRAQQQMLPRLRPTCFEDIAVEVAIVRPGPIQGGAVHPYLRRRLGEEPVTYLHPRLETVLAETLGVLLFQEQAIRVSVAAAGFNPGEADLLRRALSRERSQEAMAALQARFVAGAAEKGIDAAAAEEIFHQLAGFAGYGFCKSHAASFALIAYQTLWLKHYHPAAFYCALLNQQPMGFYPPEVLLGDARRHGVRVLPPDINRSGWRYRPERVETTKEKRPWALRTGLATIREVGEETWTTIAAAREAGPFADLGDFCARTRLPQEVVRNLIRAGACDAWGERRTLLWQLGDLDLRPGALPLAQTQPQTSVDLPSLPPLERTVWEYELMGASPAGQVMRHHRPRLHARGILSCWQVKRTRAGRRVRCAGFVVVRQRPATAKGILFMSLEDESGLLDVVVKPPVYERLRDVLRGQPLIVVEGIVQRNGRAASLLLLDAKALE